VLFTILASLNYTNLQYINLHLTPILLIFVHESFEKNDKFIGGGILSYLLQFVVFYFVFE